MRVNWQEVYRRLARAVCSTGSVAVVLTLTVDSPVATAYTANKPTLTQ